LGDAASGEWKVVVKKETNARWESVRVLPTAKSRGHEEAVTVLGGEKGQKKTERDVAIVHDLPCSKQGEIPPIEDKGAR